MSVSDSLHYGRTTSRYQHPKAVVDLSFLLFLLDILGHSKHPKPCVVKMALSVTGKYAVVSGAGSGISPR